MEALVASGLFRQSGTGSQRPWKEKQRMRLNEGEGGENVWKKESCYLSSWPAC